MAALITIRQSAPHRLWVAILLRAFRPMLGKLWKELFGSDRQERLALLLLAFQGAILHVDPRRNPVRVAMYVRQATRRRAIVALTKELRWTDVGFGEEADEVADARAPDPPSLERLRATQETAPPRGAWPPTCGAVTRHSPRPIRLASTSGSAGASSGCSSSCPRGAPPPGTR